MTFCCLWDMTDFGQRSNTFNNLSKSNNKFVQNVQFLLTRTVVTLSRTSLVVVDECPLHFFDEGCSPWYAEKSSAAATINKYIDKRCLLFGHYIPNRSTSIQSMVLWLLSCQSNQIKPNPIQSNPKHQSNPIQSHLLLILSNIPNMT